MKILLASLMLLLASCASYKKAAIKLTDEGLHEAALKQWVLAYEEDRDDPEVEAGLRMCQEKVSNERLIRIRDLRLAKEEEMALIEMQSLIDLQSTHGIRLDFNSSTFQGRETQLLSKYNNAQILILANSQKPLAAELRYRKYENVFKSMSDFNKLRTDITTSGNLQCKNIKKGLKGKPFFKSFVSQYCKFFSPGRELSSTTSIASVLYANPQIEAVISGADEQLTSQMIKALKEGFEASPWFHPEAQKTISMKISGSYKWKRNSFEIPQSHSYDVEIPYTAYVNVKKKREVPYYTSSGTKYRTETYYEKEPETRYRTETRVFKYEATKRMIEFDMAVSGKIMIDKNANSYSFSKGEVETAILHDYDMPEIKLRPRTTDVSDPNTVFGNYSVLAGIEARAELERSWIKNFCSLPQDRAFASIGENVTKCRRAPSYPVAFVDTWFENTFGVNSRDAETLIGKF